MCNATDTPLSSVCASKQTGKFPDVERDILRGVDIVDVMIVSSDVLQRWCTTGWGGQARGLHILAVLEGTMASLLRPSRFHRGANQFALHSELERGMCVVFLCIWLHLSVCHFILPMYDTTRQVCIKHPRMVKDSAHANGPCACTPSVYSTAITVHGYSMSSCGSLPASL